MRRNRSLQRASRHSSTPHDRVTILDLFFAALAGVAIGSVLTASRQPCPLLVPPPPPSHPFIDLVGTTARALLPEPSRMGMSLEQEHVMPKDKAPNFAYGVGGVAASKLIDQLVSDVLATDPAVQSDDPVLEACLHLRAAAEASGQDVARLLMAAKRWHEEPYT